MVLSGRKALITGAASGIGRALARRWKAEGVGLLLVDRQEGPLRALAAELGAQAEVMDVADRAAWERLAAQWGEGPLHLLVNNAGLTVLGGFEEHSPADWERVMGVNFFGPVWACRAFLPALRREGGRIVNISSLFGLMGVPGQSGYCASKYALRGLSEALHQELAGSGVGVTVVHPGGVSTAIIDSAIATPDARLQGEARARLSRFFARKAMPAERAAELITGAVRRDQHRLRVGAEAVGLDLLRRLAPEWGNDLGVSMMKRVMGLPG
jgi:NAD(P)-dependent dehydrogenase (short-subunit alcohol dehydrogenase family)